ncbi:MAG: flagellar basal body-associated FliL family protein [Vicinamibacterales bacterium]|jgi:flagellar basal body-associated protein FliL
MSDTPQSTSPADAKRSPNKKILYLALAAGVIGGIGGGGYWWSLRAAPAEESHTPPAEAAEVPAHKRGLITFEPFVVNLADAGTSRFLRVTVRLVVDSPERAKEIEESAVVLMAARAAILELLTTQTSEALVTPAGKAALRAAIAERVGHDGEVKVHDVLFSDFVVQF